MVIPALLVLGHGLHHPLWQPYILIDDPQGGFCRRLVTLPSGVRRSPFCQRQLSKFRQTSAAISGLPFNGPRSSSKYLAHLLHTLVVASLIGVPVPAFAAMFGRM